MSRMETDQVIPPCMSKWGCEIEDAVTDEGVVDFVDKYIRTVHLRNMTGIDDIGRHTLAELGLLDDPDTLFELEKEIIAKIQRDKDSNGTTG
jgi:hypothetical protein